MPAAFALQAATRNASRLLRRAQDVGSVSAGKYADIIAVDGDPLADITRMQHVAFVMKGGVVYKQAGQPVAEVP
jgi:imidazolonepropionase-like amidohydrolase